MQRQAVCLSVFLAHIDASQHGIATLGKGSNAFVDVAPPPAQVVLSKIRDRFGGNLKVSFVGGAATSMEVLNFFENIDIKILEGYGLTETSPLTTVNTPEQVGFCSSCFLFVFNL